MARGRRTIDPAVKAAVLAALVNTDVNIPELAKQYNLSVPTIYNYRKTLLATAAEPIQA